MHGHGNNTCKYRKCLWCMTLLNNSVIINALFDRFQANPEGYVYDTRVLRRTALWTRGWSLAMYLNNYYAWELCKSIKTSLTGIVPQNWKQCNNIPRFPCSLQGFFILKILPLPNANCKIYFALYSAKVILCPAQCKVGQLQLVLSGPFICPVSLMAGKQQAAH